MLTRRENGHGLLWRTAHSTADSGTRAEEVQRLLAAGDHYSTSHAQDLSGAPRVGDVPHRVIGQDQGTPVVISDLSGERRRPSGWVRRAADLAGGVVESVEASGCGGRRLLEGLHERPARAPVKASAQLDGAELIFQRELLTT